MTFISTLLTGISFGGMVWMLMSVRLLLKATVKKKRKKLMKHVKLSALIMFVSGTLNLLDSRGSGKELTCTVKSV